MNDDEKENKLGTRLNTDDLIGRAAKPPNNLVPRNNKSLGFIRYKEIRGRIYYYWCRTEYQANKPPRQKTIAYLGQVLPTGVRLGTVDERMAKKIRRHQNSIRQKRG